MTRYGQDKNRSVQTGRKSKVLNRSKCVYVLVLTAPVFIDIITWLLEFRHEVHG